MFFLKGKSYIFDPIPPRIYHLLLTKLHLLVAKDRFQLVTKNRMKLVWRFCRHFRVRWIGDLNRPVQDKRTAKVVVVRLNHSLSVTLKLNVFSRSNFKGQLLKVNTFEGHTVPFQFFAFVDIAQHIARPWGRVMKFRW